MPERQTPRRTPDRSALGDANIPDFLEQQQGAADLTDFALQSNAGANIAGGITADAAQLTAQPQLSTDIDLSGYVVSFGSVAVDIVTTDPVGAGASLKVTPTAGVSEVDVLGPLIALPAGSYVHLVGGYQYHRVTNDGRVAVNVNWYDATGATVGTDNFIPLGAPFNIDASTADTWLHVDKLLQVPANAVLYSLDFTTQFVTTLTANVAEVTYFNNFQLKGASQFDGVHSGLVTQRAAWWLPWGRSVAPYTNTGFTQAVTSATPVSLTGMFITMPCIAGRQYKVTLAGFIGVQSGTGGISKVFLADGSNNLLAIAIDAALAVAAAAGSRELTNAVYTWLALATGDVIIKVRAQTSAGTFTIQNDTATTGILLGEDIGGVLEPPEGFLQ